MYILNIYFFLVIKIFFHDIKLFILTKIYAEESYESFLGSSESNEMFEKRLADIALLKYLKHHKQKTGKRNMRVLNQFLNAHQRQQDN